MILLALLAALAQDGMPDATSARGEARLSVWLADLDGSVVADEGLFEGTHVRMDRDLDLGGVDPLMVLEGRISSTAGEGYDAPEVVRVSATFWTHAWTGSSTLVEDETFNGVVFPAGSAVDGRFQVGVGGVDVVLFPELPERGHLGILLGGRYSDVKATMDGPVADVSERTRLAYFGVGFAGEFRPWPRVKVSGVFAPYFTLGHSTSDGLLSVEDWSGTWLEASLSVAFEIRRFRVALGRRIVWNRFLVDRDTSDGVDEDNAFRFSLNGTFLEAGISF